MKELMTFSNLDDYGAWLETVRDPIDKPALINDGWMISMDLMAKCKKWKTAVRKLAKAVSQYDVAFNWLMETVMESCENGCFGETDGWKVYGEDNDKLRKKYGCYGWGVEQVDEDRWYVFLNLSGTWAGNEPRTDLEGGETV